MTVQARRASFRALHTEGCTTMPNPWDVGSARLMAHAGARALATTSAGLAATLGRLDMTVTREELVAHTALLATATPLPLNVDAERGFGDTPGEVAETVALLAEAGAAGCSVEDWNPATDAIDPLEVSVARVAAAAAEADRHGMVLTARCEHHLHGVDDLDATIGRLRAYAQAGAGCVYAPGLVTAAQVGEVCAAVPAAVNVLLLPVGPTVPELAELGVRRVSLGSRLSSVAFGAALAAVRGVLADGQVPAGLPSLTRDDAANAFA